MGRIWCRGAVLDVHGTARWTDLSLFQCRICQPPQDDHCRGCQEVGGMRRSIYFADQMTFSVAVHARELNINLQCTVLCTAFCAKDFRAKQAKSAERSCFC